MAIQVKDIENLLHSNKAQQISTYQYGDHFIVASADSLRHTKALAQILVEHLKENAIKHKIEGMKHGNWVVVDMGNIMVHLFRSDVREYYDVDSLWVRPPEIKTTDINN